MSFTYSLYPDVGTRFTQDAFDGQIGKTTKVHYRGRTVEGRVTEAKVAEDGSHADLTIDADMFGLVPSPFDGRHPLHLVSLLARQFADTDDWDGLSPEQQSDCRMLARRAVQGMAKAGFTEEEAAMLVRYYRETSDVG